MKILLLETKDVANYEKVLQHLNIDYTISTEANDEYDGLLIPGGVDINPKYYNEEIDPKCGKIDDELDAKQFKAINYFIEQKKPIMGICRGFQFINVIFGGSLIQDIESDIEHRWFESTGVSYHSINNLKGFMKDLYGPTATVNSHHHQGIKRLGNGLEVISSSDDGMIEAIQHKELPVIAVQFHPERMTLEFASDKIDDGMRIFNYFFNTFFTKCK